MTIQEAAKISGYTVWTLQKFARNNQFAASKPRGNRGGWEIEEVSFLSFLKRRKLAGANDVMRELEARRAKWRL